MDAKITNLATAYARLHVQANRAYLIAGGATNVHIDIDELRTVRKLLREVIDQMKREQRETREAAQ